jgi:nitroreductase
LLIKSSKGMSITRMLLTEIIKLMDFIKLARERYSCRNYKQINVEEDKLNLVLEAGRIAPSAVNYQPWYFIVAQGENLENVRSCYHRDWFRTAPMCIVVCADHSRSWKRGDKKDHADIDAAIAADHITLAATSVGLATCWICNFNAEKLTEVLNLPKYVEPIVVLPLGYPEDSADAKRHSVKRKPLNDIVVYEKFKL